LESKNFYALGYRPGDGFVAERELGTGPGDDVGYVQCPDPERPYTCRGTVIFELRSRRVDPAG